MSWRAAPENLQEQTESTEFHLGERPLISSGAWAGNSVYSAASCSISSLSEHRFPNNVAPELLEPTKALKIHPIKLLAER